MRNHIDRNYYRDGHMTEPKEKSAVDAELPAHLTLEQAFGVTVTLFKDCQAERDQLRAEVESLRAALASVDENGNIFAEDLNEELKKEETP